MLSNIRRFPQLRDHVEWRVWLLILRTPDPNIWQSNVGGPDLGSRQVSTGLPVAGEISYVTKTMINCCPNRKHLADCVHDGCLFGCPCMSNPSIFSPGLKYPILGIGIGVNARLLLKGCLPRLQVAWAAAHNHNHTPHPQPRYAKTGKALATLKKKISLTYSSCLELPT